MSRLPLELRGPRNAPLSAAMNLSTNHLGGAEFRRLFYAPEKYPRGPVINPLLSLGCAGGGAYQAVAAATVRVG